MATISTDIAQQIDIIIRSADSFNLQLQVKNSDNSNFDLTGYKIYFEIKSTVSNELMKGFTNNTSSPYNESGSLYNISSISLAEAENGVISIAETADNMDFIKGTYKYTIKLESSAGNLKTWAFGKFKVNDN
tara:strand:+ start:63 stop:458 length:396 start_codon:yes stop_codon:yes gene_type:complete